MKQRVSGKTGGKSVYSVKIISRVGEILNWCFRNTKRNF